jgi:hypothetical protein
MIILLTVTQLTTKEIENQKHRLRGAGGLPKVSINHLHD